MLRIKIRSYSYRVRLFAQFPNFAFFLCSNVNRSTEVRTRAIFLSECSATCKPRDNRSTIAFVLFTINGQHVKNAQVVCRENCAKISLVTFNVIKEGDNDVL